MLDLVCLLAVAVPAKTTSPDSGPRKRSVLFLQSQEIVFIGCTAILQLPSLLLPQSYERIYPRSAPGREGASDKRDDEEQSRHCCKGKEIEWRNSKKDLFEVSACNK